MQTIKTEKSKSERKENLIHTVCVDTSDTDESYTKHTIIKCLVKTCKQPLPVRKKIMT